MKPIYKRGARKEYYIAEKLKKQGFDIVQRTARSNSPIDIIAVNSIKKKILLIQSKRTLKEKMSYTDPELKKKIEAENQALTGLFWVDFEVQ